MRVGDGADIRALSVNLRMDVEFERRLGAALDQVAVEIDGDDVFGGERAAHRGAGIDVEARGVAPCATMAVVVDDGGALQHADRIDEKLFCLMLRHSTVSDFQTLTFDGSRQPLSLAPQAPPCPSPRGEGLAWGASAAH